METVEKDEMIEQQKLQKEELRKTFQGLLPLYFLSVISSITCMYFYFSSYSSKEFIVSASLILLNFILVLLFDGLLVKTLQFVLWGMVMKLIKTFSLFAILAVLAVAGAVTDPKHLIIGYAIGFFVGHVAEVFILTKLLVFNKVTHAK
jgi:hypothetical protein